MNIETKVGLFILLGLFVALGGIFKLSNISLASNYKIYFLFDDIKNLQDKSPIKIAGVEVGRVDGISLEEGKARVRARIHDGVALYADAQVEVKQTGLIGSQFLNLSPGTPAARQLEDGDTIFGSRGHSLEDLMDRVAELLGGKDGKPGLSENLNATVANLRQMTGTLNETVSGHRGELAGIIQNLHAATVDLKGMARDMHEITNTRKEDVSMIIEKLRSILDRVDTVVAKIQNGEGSIGKLVADPEMADNVKQTVANLKDTSASAKQVLQRFTKVRSYWEFEGRYSPVAQVMRADAGIRLSPREGKYYFLGVNNIGNVRSEFKQSEDYEKKNTITAVLGKEFGPVTVELGALRSSAGLGLRWNPFEPVAKKDAAKQWLNRIELNTAAFDFGRDETRGKSGHERQFKGPQYNLGMRVRINRWMQVGAGVEDLSETAQFTANTRVIFEDKDLAYLFGFVSFAR